jgi:hypothetical protein
MAYAFPAMLDMARDPFGMIDGRVVDFPLDSRDIPHGTSAKASEDWSARSGQFVGRCGQPQVRDCRYWRYLMR